MVYISPYLFERKYLQEHTCGKVTNSLHITLSRVFFFFFSFFLKTLIEHLHSLKFKLEKEKKIQKRKKKNLQKGETKQKESKINGTGGKNQSQHKNEKVQTREISKKTLMRSDDIPVADDSKGDYVCPIPQLIKTIEIYKHKNEEEQREKIYLIEKYENVLRKIRKRHILQIGQIKNQVLLDVDFLIQKYRNISLELLQIGRKKEKEKRQDKEKITKMCISACKRFETDVKERAKTSIQTWQTEMAKSISDERRENENLKKEISELKKKIHEKKHNEQSRELKLLQNRIREECAINEELKSIISHERKEHEMNLIDLYSKVDLQIKNYEENIVKVFHDILSKNKINMERGELSHYIQVAMDMHYEKGNPLMKS
ncbi:hypothetical protein, conserved [Plasmodium gonderi]|uniref:Uncharacterized protein n=1 Tax=Plasmodium gonderi TaxID=77519 RepID=A0A1Y1JH77_PLAGO|nr:hypothetical protein, conserved [Plasmodium gonderi]GAW81871.1 hypothetical protein, conserved [Plasmodium gonderi]